MIEDFNLSKCPNCQYIAEIVPGEIDRNIRDEEGKKLSEESCVHFANHRVRCNKCSENFCSRCKAHPYHLGMTCEQFKAPRCRFCHSLLPEEEKESVQKLICTQPECVQKSTNMCQKRHYNCDHPCQGFLNEKDCLPCLHQRCSKKNELQLKGQDLDSLCTICYTDDFRSAPCV